jgi:hypothetical protein
MKLSTILNLAVIVAAAPSVFGIGPVAPVPDGGASALLLGIGSVGLLAAPVLS